MLKQQLYLKLASDLIIPILGFWIWDWSLYFILLFFMLDIISSEIVIHLKSRKIIQFNVENRQYPIRNYTIISALFLMTTILFIHLGILLLHPKMNIQQEIWHFLTYTELGIPQGFLLIPLVFVVAYTSYKTEFIQTQLFMKLDCKTLWKKHITLRFLVLIFCVLLALFGISFKLSEATFLIIVLIVITLYNYLQGRELLAENK